MPPEEQPKAQETPKPEEQPKTEEISREEAIAKAFPEDLTKSEEPKKEETPKSEEPKKEETPKSEEPKKEEEPKKKKKFMDRFSKEEPKKQEEPKEADEIWEEPKGADEKQLVDFRRLKAKRDEEVSARDTQIQELQQKLSDAQKAQGDPEIERLKTENEQLNSRLKELDFQSTPEFENAFVKPRQEALKGLESLVKEHGMEVDLTALLSKKGKELGEAVSEAADTLPDFYKSEFIDGIRTVLDIDRKRGEALQNADQYREGLYARRRQEQEKAVDAVWDQLSGDNQALLEPMEGDSETDVAYNEALQGIKQQVRNYTSSSQTESDIALISSKAAMFDFFMSHGIPRMESEWRDLVELNDAQAAKLADLKEQNPKTRTPSSEEKESGELSREEAVEKAFPTSS